MSESSRPNRAGTQSQPAERVTHRDAEAQAGSQSQKNLVVFGRLLKISQKMRCAPNQPEQENPSYDSKSLHKTWLQVAAPDDLLESSRKEEPEVVRIRKAKVRRENGRRNFPKLKGRPMNSVGQIGDQVWDQVDCNREGDAEHTELSFRKPSKLAQLLPTTDRKSTRLNSSHANISYAVFGLKKEN